MQFVRPFFLGGTFRILPQLSRLVKNFFQILAFSFLAAAFRRCREALGYLSKY
jgi:hypothetical protein